MILKYRVDNYVSKQYTFKYISDYVQRAYHMSYIPFGFYQAVILTALSASKSCPTIKMPAMQTALKSICGEGAGVALFSKSSAFKYMNDVTASISRTAIVEEVDTALIARELVGTLLDTSRAFREHGLVSQILDSSSAYVNKQGSWLSHYSIVKQVLSEVLDGLEAVTSGRRTGQVVTAPTFNRETANEAVLTKTMSYDKPVWQSSHLGGGCEGVRYASSGAVVAEYREFLKNKGAVLDKLASMSKERLTDVLKEALAERMYKQSVEVFTAESGIRGTGESGSLLYSLNALKQLDAVNLDGEVAERVYSNAVDMLIHQAGLRAYNSGGVVGGGVAGEVLHRLGEVDNRLYNLTGSVSNKTGSVLSSTSASHIYYGVVSTQGLAERSVEAPAEIGSHFDGVIPYMHGAIINHLQGGRPDKEGILDALTASAQVNPRSGKMGDHFEGYRVPELAGNLCEQIVLANRLDLYGLLKTAATALREAEQAAEVRYSINTTGSAGRAGDISDILTTSTQGTEVFGTLQQYLLAVNHKRGLAGAAVSGNRFTGESHNISNSVSALRSYNDRGNINTSMSSKLLRYGNIKNQLLGDKGNTSIDILDEKTVAHRLMRDIYIESSHLTASQLPRSVVVGDTRSEAQRVPFKADLGSYVDAISSVNQAVYAPGVCGLKLYKQADRAKPPVTATRCGEFKASTFNSATALGGLKTASITDLPIATKGTYKSILGKHVEADRKAWRGGQVDLDIKAIRVSSRLAGIDDLTQAVRIENKQVIIHLSKHANRTDLFNMEQAVPTWAVRSQNKQGVIDVATTLRLAPTPVDRHSVSWALGALYTNYPEDGAHHDRLHVDYSPTDPYNLYYSYYKGKGHTEIENSLTDRGGMQVTDAGAEYSFYTEFTTTEGYDGITGVVLDYKDSRNYKRLEMLPMVEGDFEAAMDSMRLLVVRGGVQTVVTPLAPFGYINGITYSVKAVRDKSTLYIYVNNILEFAVTG